MNGACVSLGYNVCSFGQVLEHCYMWHVIPGGETQSSNCLPEILLQKETFQIKMGRFKQALVRMVCGLSSVVVVPHNYLVILCCAASME